MIASRVEVFGLIFVINVVNAVNAVKKIYFTAFHRISYKNSPQNSLHFLQKFTASNFVAN